MQLPELCMLTVRRMLLRSLEGRGRGKICGSQCRVSFCHVLQKVQTSNMQRRKKPHSILPAPHKTAYLSTFLSRLTFGQTSKSAAFTFASVALLDDAPQLRENAQRTMFNNENIKLKSASNCRIPYESRAVVTEGGFHVRGFLEVVDKAEAQFGADDAGPHEISRDLLSAHLAFPEQSNTTNIK